MNDFKIQHFTNYVLRTPAFPVLDYLQLLENYSDDALLKIYKNAFFIHNPPLGIWSYLKICFKLQMFV